MLTILNNWSQRDVLKDAGTQHIIRKALCHQFFRPRVFSDFFFPAVEECLALTMFWGWCAAAHNVSKGHQIHSVSVLRCYITILPFLILVWQYIFWLQWENVIILQQRCSPASASCPHWLYEGMGVILNIKDSFFLFFLCIFCLCRPACLSARTRLQFVTVEKTKWAECPSIQKMSQNCRQRV